MKNSTCCKSLLSFAFALFALLLFNPQTAKASHLMGGEITVTHVSGTTYKITQKIYRDCAGIALDPTTFVTLAGPTGSTTVTLNRVSVTDRTPLCPGQVSRC